MEIQIRQLLLGHTLARWAGIWNWPASALAPVFGGIAGHEPHPREGPGGYAAGGV